MTDELRVRITKYGDRRFWVMYYDDPLSGKRVTRSTRKTTRREAERVAGVWEDELRSGRFKPKSNVTWAEFRDRYETEVLPSMADKTFGVVCSVFNALERLCNPKKLSSLSADRLSYFQKRLREAGKSEATIRTYLAHLKAALKWAVEMGLLGEVPKVKMPKRAKGSKMMKGRPVTGEEFERILAAVPRVVGEAAAPSWQWFLRGLWFSGLRLGEALNLFWDDDTRLTVDLSGRRPMLRIRAELEKGGRDRLLPITPDFAEMLCSVPVDERTGPVFRLVGIQGHECRDIDWVSRIIVRIGTKAGVKVHTSSDGRKVKFASAHDLRRSFGERWASRLMPKQLQELMRHEDIDTTMKFYVGQNAEATADAVWQAFESKSVHTFVNSHPPNG